MALKIILPRFQEFLREHFGVKFRRPVAQIPLILSLFLLTGRAFCESRLQVFLGPPAKVHAGTRLKVTFRRTMLLTSVRNETVRAV